MTNVCVVILNYGTPALTISCAESVLSDLGQVDGEVIIVDNASPDDSFDQFAAWHDSKPKSAPIKLVRSENNGGYSSGNNQGIKAGNADFFVLANSDTVVKPDALKVLINQMRADPKIGILGPQLLGPEGNPIISRFRHLTPFGEFLRATGMKFFFDRFPRHVIPVEDHEPESAMQWVGFPFIMFRRSMIEEIGLLDERYFMYFEDSAYCRRASAHGWRIAHCKEAVVQHFCGQSSKVEDRAAANKRLPAYYYASRARYLISHYGRRGFVAANLFWYLGRCVSYLRLLALKSPNKACAGQANDIWIGPNEDHRVAVST